MYCTLGGDQNLCQVARESRLDDGGTAKLTGVNKVVVVVA